MSRPISEGVESTRKPNRSLYPLEQEQQQPPPPPQKEKRVNLHGQKKKKETETRADRQLERLCPEAKCTVATVSTHRRTRDRT